ncbi:MAG: M23 family metallopeptidase [Gammaproteobacteria bacterium]|nr:M23 family metallopeptidase [Gammaproteobacteria bacterium]CAJ2377034.1 MAG: putative Peptidase_M23 domain-containing protein [Arenicellales bacterium IbO2]MDA7962161.1 M23 family metallopeptidase [Gammaproteobacteria bacterium]MDA7968713.1 M23 family metallopeptidase [Gammaproteobacteria bacterium]MDA7970879.1 M23 family metallopeptidase [Gammaproteobacteria bacterium]
MKEHHENRKSHKDHLVITVSALSGSRHFTIKKSVKQAFLASAAVLSVVFVVSLTSNYFHGEQMDRVTAHNELLEKERARLDKVREQLSVELTEQQDLNRSLRDDLDEIEHLLGLHHPDKVNEKKGDLVARMDMAKLTANQEKILHRSVPSGFPIGIYKITSEYGMRRHPVTGRKAMHNGVDLRTRGNVNVYATADGVVRLAKRKDLSGLLIIVQHNFGFESYYAHLSDILVQSGEVVQRGQLLGISGNTGDHSTGPHLHYEVRHLGKALDPMPFLHWELGSNELFAQVKEVQWPSLINLIQKQVMRQTLQLSQQAPSSPATSP